MPGSGSPAQDAKVIVPKLNTDPIWSLRPWPVVLHIAGEDYEIPAMPAADWLVHLMASEPDLDAFLDEFVPDLEDLLLDERVYIEEVYELCLDMISTVTARPWWVALRLINVARQSWDILGPDLIKRQVDPERHSIAAWLDVLLISALNSMEPKDTTMFTMKLEAKPQLDGGVTVPLDEMEMDRSAFLAMGMG